MRRVYFGRASQQTLYHPPGELLPPPVPWPNEEAPVVVNAPPRVAAKILKDRLSIAEFFEAVDAALAGKALLDPRVDAYRAQLYNEFQEAALSSELTKMTLG